MIRARRYSSRSRATWCFKTVQDGRIVDIPIREGELFLLPRRSTSFAAAPRRHRGHRRRAAPQPRGTRWLLMVLRTMRNIGCTWSASRSATSKPNCRPNFPRFYVSRAQRTCSNCGTVMQAPVLSTPGTHAAAALAWMPPTPFGRFAAEFHHPDDSQRPQADIPCRPLTGLAAQQPTAHVHRTGTRRLAPPWRARSPRGVAVPGSATTNVWHRALAELLAGAELHEVVAMNSLTINLHLMMVSFFRPAAATRNRIS